MFTCESMGTSRAARTCDLLTSLKCDEINIPSGGQHLGAQFYVDDGPDNACRTNFRIYPLARTSSAPPEDRQ
jgi:hypothetical protein